MTMQLCTEQCYRSAVGTERWPNNKSTEWPDSCVDAWNFSFYRECDSNSFGGPTILLHPTRKGASVAAGKCGRSAGQTTHAVSSAKL